MSKPRVAIVLFNLGGPDRPESVRPFLLNLFRDPAILRVPFFVRPFLARLIARRRLAPATHNYAILGGKSPLLELTQAQGSALETALSEIEAKCFIAMRYWHPFSLATARDVKAWEPDEIILLPLYPQFSTTTTGSSLQAWRDAAAQAGLIASVTTLCCWFDDAAFITATAGPIRDALDRTRAALPVDTPVRVLFSAHGLPEIIVQQGDPYQWQIERCAEALAAVLDEPDLDWTVCYQSRATPQKWLDPSTDHEIERAAREHVALVVVPLAFVSEHSETLVELDVEYGQLAKRLGVPVYTRVPTQNSDPDFIGALAGLVRHARARGPGLCSGAGARLCPPHFAGCPMPSDPLYRGHAARCLRGEIVEE